MSKEKIEATSNLQWIKRQIGTSRIEKVLQKEFITSQGNIWRDVPYAGVDPNAIGLSDPIEESNKPEGINLENKVIVNGHTDKCIKCSSQRVAHGIAFDYCLDCNTMMVHESETETFALAEKEFLKHKKRVAEDLLVKGEAKIEVTEDGFVKELESEQDEEIREQIKESIANLVNSECAVHAHYDSELIMSIKIKIPEGVFLGDEFCEDLNELVRQHIEEKDEDEGDENEMLRFKIELLERVKAEMEEDIKVLCSDVDKPFLLVQKWEQRFKLRDEMTELFSKGSPGKLRDDMDGFLGRLRDAEESEKSQKCEAKDSDESSKSNDSCLCGKNKKKK